jgi:hypothetical protein
MVKPNWNSIVDPCKGYIEISESLVSDFVKDFNLYKGLPSFNSSDISLSNKAGPQGPASMTALKNLSLYDKDLINDLYNLTDTIGQLYLSKSIDQARRLGELPKYDILGKVSFVRDPEAKLRIIAIADYYTQLYLKPIHNDILSLLKGLNCDRTFTQNPFHD